MLVGRLPGDTAYHEHDANVLLEMQDLQPHNQRLNFVHSVCLTQTRGLCMKEIKLGPIVAKRGDQSPARAAILLWGPAGAGKTTFAATAPGRKLVLAFGDNEATPIAKRSDVMIADMSVLGFDELFNHAKNDNPFGLDQVLHDNEDITTVVVDSATAIAYRALQKAVGDGIGRGKGFSPSMEAPGIAAYGGRNAIVLETLTGFLRVTAKHNVNIVITAHEDDPTMRMDTVGGRPTEVVDFITIQLGGKLVNNMTWRLSEIWNLRESNNKRLLTVRSYGQRKPMKTRMFAVNGKTPQIDLVYDPMKPDDDKKQMTIAAWHEGWLDNGRRGLPIPATEKSV